MIKGLFSNNCNNNVLSKIALKMKMNLFLVKMEELK